MVHVFVFLCVCYGHCVYVCVIVCLANPGLFASISCFHVSRLVLFYCLLKNRPALLQERNDETKVRVESEPFDHDLYVSLQQV